MHKDRLEAFSDGVIAWISLFPFVTGWMGENHFATWTVATCGVVLNMAAVAIIWLIPDRRIEKTLVA